jgi:hypothetical protein
MLIRSEQQTVNGQLATVNRQLLMPLVQMASFENTIEAETARVALEHEGIQAFVDGAATANALSHVGTALGGVRLMVAKGDAQRAAKVMDLLAREARLDKAPWFCGVCREEVEATFDVCWSCQGDRSSVEVPRPQAAADLSSKATEAEAPGEDSAVEAMLARAWRAAVIGIIFLPILLHLYSMWLLLRASTSGAAFSQQGSRRFYQAFAINLVAGCLWGIAFWVYA